MKNKHTNLPIEKLPKLVRDKIPEIIRKSDNCDVKTKTLIEDEAFLKALLKKLGEECAELEYSLKEGNLEEELADVLEIVDAILRLKGLKLREIRAIQNKKRQKRGGFKKRILLVSKLK